MQMSLGFCTMNEYWNIPDGGIIGLKESCLLGWEFGERS